MLASDEAVKSVKEHFRAVCHALDLKVCWQD